MTQLYILGLLLRFGPQHGYQLKKIVNEQLSDFTQIKLPTIYYHLEKLQAEGLLKANSEKPGSRPEKTIYEITAKGEETLRNVLQKKMEFSYNPNFEADGVFYFAEYTDIWKLFEKLISHITKLEQTIKGIEQHKTEALEQLPKESRVMAEIIFNHHLTHYQAEYEWAKDTLKQLQKK